MKNQCGVAIDMLISKLERRFPLHELMDALGIVWLYYWLVLGWEAALPIPMAVLKAQNYNLDKDVGPNGWVECPLGRETLDLRMTLFKLTMKT